ncbi:MAG: hypothetical protein H7Y18_10865 [Clostridiaceae bacterium]|nr:hypothetical protein [Clostridiaceae bacterium]
MSSILSNLLDFRSKEEKSRSFEAYSKKIFPYGDAQKDAISENLAALFPTERQNYLVMYYVLIKEEMTAEDSIDFESAVAKAKKYKLLNFTSKLQAGIKSLLNADFDIDENLQYPTLEELQASATDILFSWQNNE